MIGIIASRLLEKYQKPVIVITSFGEIARGSARSVPGFSIYDVINTCCSDYLLRFGGHPMAAGFDVNLSDIHRLKSDIFDYLEEKEVPSLALNLDAEISSVELTYELANFVSQLEPFGKNNEKPIFKISNVTLESMIPLKGGKHIKLIFIDPDKNRFSVLKFFESAHNFQYRIGDILDLAINIETNTYNGKNGVTSILVEAKFSDLDEQSIVNQRRTFENLISRRYTIFKEKDNDILPERKDFALVYRYIKSYRSEKIKGNINIFYYRLGQKTMSFKKFLLIMFTFCETGIIDFTLSGDFFCMNMKEVKQKVNLKESCTLSKICGY